MKMRVLQSTEIANTCNIATELAREFKCTCDQIPPAYPCENEKLLIIGTYSKGKKPCENTMKFCKDLTPVRAKNVAFFATYANSQATIDELKATLKKNGVNVVGATFECVTKGMFKTAPLTPANISDAKAWAKKIVDGLSD